MKIHVTQRTLELKHTWRISRGEADAKTYCYLAIEAEGMTGYGEAAHNARYGESLDSIHSFIAHAQPVLQNANLRQFHPLLQQIQKLAPGQQAAKAAIDLAVMDWFCKQLHVPLYRYLGLDKSKTAVTSYSLPIEKPAVLQERIGGLSEFPILKIKLGGGRDEETLQAVRAVSNATLRVDANEGWTDRNEALEKIEWLHGQGVEFVEQPLPAGRLHDVAWLRERSPLPLVADEDVKTSADLPALSKCYDGINIKLMKAGGLLEALRMIYIARASGLKIMLGCMIESSLGITAAAHLSPLVDWADLDGNLLVRNDPFRGATVQRGKLLLPDLPGLGAVPVENNQAS